MYTAYDLLRTGVEPPGWERMPVSERMVLIAGWSKADTASLVPPAKAEIKKFLRQAGKRLKAKHQS